MDVSNPPDTGFQFGGCAPSEGPRRAFTDHKNPFVDLHLDFPVRFGKYVRGETPYLRVMEELKNVSDSPMEMLARLSFHNQRLDQLNYFHDLADEIRVIIRLYNGKNKQLFKQRVGKFLKKDLGLSLKPEDINAALYQFLTFIFVPFVHFDEIKYLVDGFTEILQDISGKPLDDFVSHIAGAGFLTTLQKDCLKLYPEIYEAELPLRPALYLDLIDDYEKAKIAARISTKDFQSYKDLYKDIIEVFSRQLVLVAGINNIIYRNDFNEFATVSGGKLSSLNKFSEKNLADRFKYLDECWYEVNREVIDTPVRNAIAHNNVDYDEVTQVISYYPEGGRIQSDPPGEIYFIDFMRMILISFREVNNLHHLIKCLFYYDYLILKKK
ncbi:hypothetical protein ASL22_03690 [Alcaligenes faecalis]|nr:hypothetical protein ASL22_03690 [Alcaligenes faecalis]